MSSSGSWKGAEIAHVLQQISHKYTLSYVVSDNGTNLKSACQSLSYIHIEDWTHSLANILKGFYKGNADFEGFCKWANTLRKQWFLSKDKSAYLPPTQRGKVRFANLFGVVNWGAKWLEKWSQIPENIQKDLGFLQQYRDLIHALTSLEKTIAGLSKILKNNGYCLENKDKLAAILADEKHTVFRQQVGQYLDRLEEKRAILNQENVLCCSDIIESFFGKFKMKLDNNSPKKMTEFIYTMANFGKEFTQEEIKKALESVKIADLKASKIKQK